MAISTLILATLLSSGQDDWRPPTPLNWLHGTWVCRVSGTGAGAILRREHWQPDDWSGTHGEVEEVRGGVRVGEQALAFGRILDRREGGFWLSHRMRGAGGGAPTSYASVRVGDREVEFMTDEAVEPRRIRFRRTASSLIVTHMRRDGSGARSWHMRPEGVRGGYRGCDGRR